MRPIFNKKVVEKRGLWVLWIMYETHWTVPFQCKFGCQRGCSHASQLKKKEKETQTQGRII